LYLPSVKIISQVFVFLFNPERFEHPPRFERLKELLCIKVAIKVGAKIKMLRLI